MRLAILFAVALLLAGCFESAGLLLDPAAARQPITTNRDWTYGNGERRFHARLVPLANGWYDYSEARIGKGGRDGDWKHYRVLLNTLTGTGRDGIYVFATNNDGESTFTYGLVVTGTESDWQTVKPSCDRATADPAWFGADLHAAKSAGAAVRTVDEIRDACQFTARDTLMAAMRNVVAEPGFWNRVSLAAK